MRKYPFSFFVLIILFFASVLLNLHFLQNKIGIYKVERVVDGDTFQIKIDNKTESVRLIGADAPETVDPKVGVQCFGPQASQETKKVLENQNVILISDDSQGNRDIYGRLLRYVYLENGEDFNKKIIADGFAREYTFIDPYKKQLEYQHDQNIARQNKLGLWGACKN